MGSVESASQSGEKRDQAEILRFPLAVWSGEEEYPCLGCSHTEETGGITPAQGLAQALSFSLFWKGIRPSTQKAE